MLSHAPPASHLPAATTQYPGPVITPFVTQTTNNSQILTYLLKAYMHIESCFTWQCLVNYCIYSNARQVFSLNLVLNMWGRLKFKYDATSQTAPNRTTAASPNCHVRSPIFWDIPHSLSGNSLLTYWENLLVPSSRVKKSKRENREQLKLTEKNLLSVGLAHHPFLLRSLTFQKQALFLFSGEEAPQIELFSKNDHLRTVTC